jgi:hypothetical protein
MIENQNYLMSKETLEEAAEKYLQEWRLLNNIHLSNVIHAERCKNNFIAGAKWQQERSYSEQDVLDFAEWRDKYIDGLFINKHTTKELLHIWFEQFKKK